MRRGSRWGTPARPSAPLGTTWLLKMRLTPSWHKPRGQGPLWSNPRMTPFGVGTRATFTIRTGICGKWPGILSGSSTREASHPARADRPPAQLLACRVASLLGDRALRIGEGRHEDLAVACAQCLSDEGPGIGPHA